ncbi:MAG TPA: lysophospholipid acyltransferase family protein [Acidobacteriaceae bacterium]|nr:lysophospholipid acyltransferase family protein [Acidobacteriaceae bacterium]
MLPHYLHSSLLKDLARTQQNGESGVDPRKEARPGWEYWAVRGLLGVLSRLPRSVARAVGAGVGLLAYAAAARLRRVGRQNLAMALPELPESSRQRILRTSFVRLGWQLAEFAHMRRYTRDNAQRYIRYEGLDNFLTAHERGKGVLVLTGHLGAWELSSFFHSLMGFPMAMVIRRLDNAPVDEYVNAIRTLHGNRVLHKDDFARGILKELHAGETVGILMDTNMTPPQGVFVPFFGKDACTASGLARVAAHTGATVLPGFLLWEAAEKRYVLHFGEPLELVETGAAEADAIANTALFTAVLEDWIRRYPEQWLWVHRRWKTRPAGEENFYR